MSPRRPHPITPDGHYFVVRGRLWRCSNPQLSDAENLRLVAGLMRARRRVRDTQTDSEQQREARREVHHAKVALGERGPPWWGDSAPTYDRCMAVNTPYRAWYLSLDPSSH